MESNAICGLLGYGRMGSGLHEYIKGEGWEVDWIARRAGLFTADLRPIGGPRALFGKAAHQRVDVVFNTLPSDGDGGVSYRATMYFLRKGIAVVMCGKAALAHRFGPLSQYPEKLRFSASVGGASGIIPALLNERRPIQSVCGVVNTTLNFVGRAILGGAGMAEAISEARTQKLVESEEGTPTEILNAELRDLLLKTVILFNVVAKPESVLSFARLKRAVREFPEKTFERIMGERGCLPVVSIERDGSFVHDEKKCKLIFQKKFKGGWRLRVSFDHPTLMPFTPPVGLYNAITYRTVSGTEVTVSGIGAGVSATAETMIRDAKDVLHIPY